MVVARARLFDVGANEETALGDVGDSGLDARQDLGPFRRRAAELQHPDLIILPEIGIDNFEVADDRKSVVSGKSVSVRVDLGGRRIIKKKKMTKVSRINGTARDHI